MSDASFQPVLPGVVLAQCPLGPGWGGVEAAMTLAQGERLAVLDTGVRAYMPAALEPALAALGRSVADIALIVNTHGHWDHIEGNAALKAASGAPILCPAADAALLDTPPDRLLHDGDEIDLGGRTLRVVSTPGHSAGMACLYEAQRRLLIVSDAVQGYGPGNTAVPLYFYSGDQYRASLDRLLELDLETLILGHAFAWSGPARFVHHGDDARRFLLESIEAAAGTGQAARAALDAVGPSDWPALQHAFAQALAGRPGFVLDPTAQLSGLVQGVLRSELRDLGVSVP
ncbi:MAG: MBL fold metallo-hydrolase [Anaerolineae bacterium]|nr:MBL fold metallo-hydrolase [Anaerolineae bacterium]